MIILESKLGKTTLNRKEFASIEEAVLYLAERHESESEGSIANAICEGFNTYGAAWVGNWRISDTESTFVPYFTREGAQINKKRIREESGSTCVYTTQRRCGRCGGAGYSDKWRHTGSVCYDCNGAGSRGETLAKGYTAEKLEKLNATRAKRKEKAEAKRQAKILAAIEEAKAENAGILGEELYSWLESKAGSENVFLRDMNRNLTEKKFTPRMVEAVSRSRDQEIEKAKREENMIDVPEGKIVIEGSVVSMKQVDGFAYGESVWKMLVDCGEYRVYGSVPKAIADVDLGDRVRFTAQTEQKEKGFGFFKRPTKAEILERLTA